MAVTADSVVVELIAKTDGYDARIAGSAGKTETAMSKVERSAAKAEAEVQRSAERRAAAEEASARRVSEAAEKARIRQEAAQAKAAARAEELAARKAEREEAAAQKAAAAAERAAVRQAEAAERSRLAAERAATRKGEADEAAAQRAIAAAARASAQEEAAARRAETASAAAASRKAAAEEAAAQRAAAAQTRARQKQEADAKAAADAVIREAQRKASAEAAAADKALRGTSTAARNLGRQISDIGVGVAGGQSPFLIIAQQAPQVADALADTGGKAAAVASFFAGPWGAALLAAGSALAVFASKALEGGDSVENLAAKLQENAEKSQLAAQAQSIFERSLYGAAEASAELNKKLQDQNKSQIQVAQSALAAAVAIRQQNLQNLRAETSRAAIAAADATNSRNLLQNSGGLSAAGFASAYGRANDRVTEANRRLAVANRALADSESAVVEARIPLLNLDAANASDRSAAATSRHTKAVDALGEAYRRASAEARKFPAGDARRTAALDRANAAYVQGVAGANRALEADQQAIRDSKKKGPKGESAEVQAKRREAARIREVRNNEAFTNEYEQLNQQIITAQRERATTAADAAQFERQAIESDFRRRQEAIAADLSAKKYSIDEAATLNERNEYVKALRLRNVAITEDVRSLQELAAQDATTIGILQDDAQARLSIAEARDERRAIELELIRLKYQERREQLEYLRAQAQLRGDLQAQADASQRLAALPGLQRADEVGVEQRYRGRYEQYRRDIEDVDVLRDSIDRIQIQTLEAVSDELANATTKALGLKGALGDVVGEIIRIGLQRQIIGPIADFLFGAATGGAGGGVLGGVFKSLFGRASGGYVGAGQLVRVNEGASPGRVEGFRPAGAGTIIPLGRMDAVARPAQSQGGVATVRLELSEDIDARMVNIAGPVAVEIVRQAAPEIVSSATANTLAEARKMRM